MNTQQGLANNVAAFQYFGGRGIVPDALVEPVEIPKIPRLRINVVFTDLRSTAVALRRAVELAIDLAVEMQIIVPEVVPYPRPWNAQQFRWSSHVANCKRWQARLERSVYSRLSLP